jgi:hypothetical protein
MSETVKIFGVTLDSSLTFNRRVRPSVIVFGLCVIFANALWQTSNDNSYIVIAFSRLGYCD